MVELIICFGLVVLASGIDALLFNFGHYDHGMHGSRIIVRIFVFTVVNYFVFDWSWSWIIGSFFVFSSSFDILLNVMRGFSIHYHGSESYWDKYLSYVNDKLLILIRLLLFLLGIFAIIKI